MSSSLSMSTWAATQCINRKRFRHFFKKNSLVTTVTIGVISSTLASIPATTTLALFSTIPVPAAGLPHERFPYEPPSWTKGILTNPPVHGRLHIANLPTPLHVIRLNDNNTQRQESNLQHKEKTQSTKKVLDKLDDIGISLFVKRDDMSGGVELGGNKIRKLEFLLADAWEGGYDSIVTIGGEQSNHCRATAAAARMLGLEPHLILRSKRANSVTNDSNKDDYKKEFGFTGNILFDRIVGSTIYTCTPGEYGRLGSEQLVAGVCSHLEKENKKPYPIPVGGSNGLGSWGYIQAVEELLLQWKDLYNTTKTLDHIVFACGSGGTAAGIVLGIALAYRYGNDETDSICTTTTMPHIHAIGVCDDPDYFYSYVAGIADEMGFQISSYDSTTATTAVSNTTEQFIRQHVTVHQGKGLGYAVSTHEELEFIAQFALETGIALDPVYSGKALYHFFQNVMNANATTTSSSSSSFIHRGDNVLFWHTGGALGLFDKGGDLLKHIQEQSAVKRLDVYGKGLPNSIEI